MKYIPHLNYVYLITIFEWLVSALQETVDDSFKYR